MEQLQRTGKNFWYVDQVSKKEKNEHTTPSLLITKYGLWQVLENLTEGMLDPVVMDIKMGTTTFVEDAEDLDTKRMDLLQKMIKVR